MAKEIIGVIARMDWENTQTLLTAMGRSPKDTRVVQDLESPEHLGVGFLEHVVRMIDIHKAVELFVVGSCYSQTTQDILDRVNSLKNSGQLPASLLVHGLIYNPESYRLELVCKGYEEKMCCQ